MIAQAPRTSALALFVTVGLSVTFGCGSLSRIGECKKFVKLANESAAELRSMDLPNQIVPEPAAYKRLAKRFERFSSDIEGLKLKDKRLRDAAKGIQRTMEATAKECRSYAKDLADSERDDGSGAKAARRRLDKTRDRVALSIKSYRAQVADVDSLCQPQ